MEKIAISSIVVNERQRTELGDIRSLADSISKIGQLHPIILTSDNVLVTGQRRLEACKLLGHTEIYYRRLADLSTLELQAIELEENLKRSDLSWQDKAHAIARYTEAAGTIEAAASSLSMAASVVSDACTVSRELKAGLPQLAGATSISSALNIIERIRNRALANELSKVGEVEIEEFEPELELVPGQPPTSTPVIRPPAQDCQQADFLEWAAGYSGRRFNVIHCDFPYGINHDQSEQGRAKAHGGYADSPDLYFSLLRSFTTNFERFALPVSHVMFWFSMKFYIPTVQHFIAAGFRVNPHPLVWVKTDNKGIVPDVERMPRQIYETALFMSFGDRKIIKPIANAYGAPTAKSAATHLSEKPVPVLTHFFQMFVDPLAELLDPTMGGGSALRAAERLGAARVLGLDILPENVQIAQDQLLVDRRLRAMET